MTKKILNPGNQRFRKKVMKPVKMHSDKNCPVNVPLQFEVKKDLDANKKVKPVKVFENYKMTVKKTKR